MSLLKQRPHRGPIKRTLLACGGCCFGAGVILLAVTVLGLIPANAFALGHESGFRVIGALAVFGCIITAIGYLDE